MHSAVPAAGNLPVCLEALERRELLSVNQLAFLEALKQGVGGVDGLTSAVAVALSPDGLNTYAVGIQDKALVNFDRDPSTGALIFSQVFKDSTAGVDGLDGAISVALSPDGQNVYVTGGNDNAVAVFSRDAASGDLTFRQVLKNGLGGVDGLDLAYGLTVSPDGLNVYATGANEAAIAVFSRDASGGDLVFVQVLKNGQDGVSGLARDYSVVVSPDGRNVYAAGADDDSLVTFSRDLSTGELAFQQVIVNDLGGITGIKGVFALCLSPDGDNVYVAGYLDNSVAVFARNASTGLLSFVQSFQDGSGGVDGIGGASSVAVSPDGRRLYVSGYLDNAIALFERNSATGQLTFGEAKFNGIDGVNGMTGPIYLSVSPDNANVYVAAMNGNEIAVFDQAQVTLDNSVTMRLEDVAKDDASNGGTLVSDIIASGAGGDPIGHSGARTAEGLALTGVDNTHGTWQYSLDGGASWQDFGAPSQTSARLLPADALTRVRLVPSTGFTGAIDSGITFRAWDQSNGTPGGTADTISGNDTNAFSLDVGAADISVDLHVVIGSGQARSVSYTDADGTIVVISMKVGTAAVMIAGEGLAQTITKKGLIVQGTNARTYSIDLSGTTTRSSLSASVKRGSIPGATVGRITGSLAVGSLKATGVDLIGDGIVMTGDGFISKVTLKSIANGADIAMPGTGAVKGVRITVGMIGDGTDMDLGSPLRSLKAAQWTSGSLRAPFASAIAITGKKPATTGAFGANVTLTGSDSRGIALGKLSVAGAITGANISADAGGVKSIAALGWDTGSLSAAWAGKVVVKTNLQADSLALSGHDAKGKAVGTLKAGGLISVQTISAEAGIFGAIAAGGWHGGALTTQALKSLTVKGDMEGVTVRLSQAPASKTKAMGRATVRGWMDTVRILSEGNIGALTVGGLRDSDIFAGVKAGVTVLPDPATDFDALAPASIGALKIKGTVKDADGFSTLNAKVAASAVGPVTLRYAKFDNSGAAWGISSTLHAKVSYHDAGGTHVWPNLIVDLGDFTVMPA